MVYHSILCVHFIYLNANETMHMLYFVLITNELINLERAYINQICCNQNQTKCVWIVMYIYTSCYRYCARFWSWRNNNKMEDIHSWTPMLNKIVYMLLIVFHCHWKVTSALNPFKICSVSQHKIGSLCVMSPLCYGDHSFITKKQKDRGKINDVLNNSTKVFL